jgi:hypothetical protein
MGNCSDSIIGNGGNYGVSNDGLIDTGTGNDLISANDEAGFTGRVSWFGLVNQYSSGFSTILTGSGDDRIAARGENIGLLNYGLISMDGGRDAIYGEGSVGRSYGDGIINYGQIYMGADNDLIEARDKYIGLDNAKGGVINTGAGNDVVLAVEARYDNYSWAGLYNGGILYGGPGDDSIFAVGMRAIFNQGNIDLDFGNDLISAVGGTESIVNDSQGRISLGDGIDRIVVHGDDRGATQTGLSNAGTIDTGYGADTIIATGVLAQGFVNTSRINTDEGNDSILNHSASFFRNDGIVTCGAGSDVVDSLSKEFSGHGTLDLGTGNDFLKGFAAADALNARFMGGIGIDTLILKAGAYSVVRQAVDRYLIGDRMNVIGFEQFGASAGFLSLSAGASQGFVTFI